MKTLKKINQYCPIVSILLFALAAISGILHLLMTLNKSFADKFNNSIAHIVRKTLAGISSIVPFSIAEGLLIFMPILVTVIILLAFRCNAKGKKHLIRYCCILLSIISLVYTSFVFTLAPGYRTSTLFEKLGYDEESTNEVVSAEQKVNDLYETAAWMHREMLGFIDDLVFKYNSNSVMEYSFFDMNEKLNEACEKAAAKYSFFKNFKSQSKQIILSEPMTYTHISGVYSFFSGEANINVNFPDYTIPYTAAHEMVHQRGIAREDEANFFAFLVCIESDDPYIKYSGYMNVYEFLLSCANKANKDMYSVLVRKMDSRLHGEIVSFNTFYEKYRNNKAATISSAINNTYLISQGQSNGELSYGMVVDLAIAYYKTNIRTAQ